MASTAYSSAACARAAAAIRKTASNRERTRMVDSFQGSTFARPRALARPRSRPTGTAGPSQTSIATAALWFQDQPFSDHDFGPYNTGWNQYQTRSWERERRRSASRSDRPGDSDVPQSG